LNEEFRKRWESVLQILSILAPEAKKRKQTLIFLGGSAVQSSFSEPRRVSIDLDLYYSGDRTPLIELLEKKGYQVQERPSRTKMFSFYKVTLNDVTVKMDFLNADIFMGQPKKDIAEMRKLKVGKTSFSALIAKPSYLIASKFAALAIGTIGRKSKETEQIDLLKDVYDLDCFGDFSVIGGTWEQYRRIIKMQNELWKTKFSINEVNKSIEKTLLEIGSLSPERYRISDGNLGNFNEYLVHGRVKPTDLATMAYRLLMHLKATQRVTENLKNRHIQPKNIEGHLYKLSDDEGVLSFYEAALKNQFSAEELHKLKIMTPDALVFLYYAMIGYAT